MNTYSLIHLKIFCYLALAVSLSGSDKKQPGAFSSIKVSRVTFKGSVLLKCLHQGTSRLIRLTFGKEINCFFKVGCAHVLGSYIERIKLQYKDKHFCPRHLPPLSPLSNGPPSPQSRLLLYNQTREHNKTHHL